MNKDNADYKFLSYLPPIDLLIGESAVIATTMNYIVKNKKQGR
ncbi:MAG: hypothetical protein RR630_05065 [Coprobacillus sp.]